MADLTTGNIELSFNDTEGSIVTLTGTFEGVITKDSIIQEPVLTAIVIDDSLAWALDDSLAIALLN